MGCDANRNLTPHERTFSPLRAFSMIDLRLSFSQLLPACRRLFLSVLCYRPSIEHTFSRAPFEAFWARLMVISSSLLSTTGRVMRLRRLSHQSPTNEFAT